VNALKENHCKKLMLELWSHKPSRVALIVVISAFVSSTLLVGSRLYMILDTKDFCRSLVMSLENKLAT